MRVALLSTAVEFGGIDRVLATLVRHVTGGVAFLPILFKRTDVAKHGLFDALRAQGVPFEKIFIDASAHRFPTPLRDLRRTVACLRRNRVDLVHSHGYRADILGLAAARLLRLPIIATCHGYVFTDRRLGLYNRLDLLALKRFERVIAVSDSLRSDLVAHGLEPEKIQTVVNASGQVAPPDVESLRRDVRLRTGIADEDVVFGFVGRLGEEKGLQFLLEAVSTLAGNHWRVVLVGDGPHREALEAVVARKGLGTRVVFTGFQDNPGAWYAAMDVFVLPSLTEGTPMVLLEAMAFGVPPIATSVGGVPSVVTNGENGILVNPADARMLSSALQTLLNDSRLRRDIGQRARASLSARSDVRAWAEAMLAIYADVADRHRSRRAPPRPEDERR